MDIIDSHRLGLVEQLESEAVALAGRGARLGAARGRLPSCRRHARAGARLCLARGARRAGDRPGGGAASSGERGGRCWRLNRAERAALGERVRRSATTLRALDAERCAGLLMAYRLVATPSLDAEAERRLDREMLAALRAAQSARGQADAATRRALFEAHPRWAEQLIGARVEAAVATLDWPLARARCAPRSRHCGSRPRYARAERSGLARIERRLRGSKRLPDLFAANPAQAFFQLQRQTAERRRRAAEGDDLSGEDAVRHAA